MAEECTGTAVRMAQVPRALEGQQKMISEMVEMINILEKKITPAMQPDMVVGPKEPRAEKESPKCEIANALAENTARIGDCVSKISGFISRLEL